MTPKEAIEATVAAWGAGNPAALIRIAERESRLTPTAKGDASSAPESYEREHENLRKMGNPWADDRDRWIHSIGLYQFMPANYARLWSPTADPNVLYDPRIATVVAARLWNKAIQKGAADFVSVRLYWANPSWVNLPTDHPQFKKRMKSKYSIVEGVLNPRAEYFDYSAFGTGPQVGQEARLPGGPVQQEKKSEIDLVKVISLGWLGYKLWRAYVR